ncbi:MAG: hypothetical protein PHI71_05330 [Acidiphilium sp.]|jgi:hypothetical protein|nr:hypothetical protein [Acidiphilium sp.]
MVLHDDSIAMKNRWNARRGILHIEARLHDHDDKGEDDVLLGWRSWHRYYCSVDSVAPRRHLNRARSDGLEPIRSAIGLA